MHSIPSLLLSNPVCSFNACQMFLSHSLLAERFYLLDRAFFTLKPVMIILWVCVLLIFLLQGVLFNRHFYFENLQINSKVKSNSTGNTI